MSEGRKYLVNLGFEPIDVDFTSGTIDHNLEDNSEATIYVHFDRKTIMAWHPGYDVTILIGNGLTNDEERKLSSVDAKRSIDESE